MTAKTSRQPLISVEEYLRGEQSSEVRHEYIDGQVYAMVGASRSHGLTLNALAFALTPAARRKSCQLFTSDMKVRVDIGSSPVFYYPDLLITCDQNDRTSYYSTQPCLIIEVLSETTERIDRREKLLAYQTLPSLREYLLVAQDARHVEVYRRTKEWQAEYHDAGDIFLGCLNEALSLDAIYADVSI